ncbi:MAG: ABC transporter ATP-binding protein [Mycoplasmatales bacterium]|nr:ABC transporter ATP-binding protein [Mycoplasmatales bacterium]
MKKNLFSFIFKLKKQNKKLIYEQITRIFEKNKVKTDIFSKQKYESFLEDINKLKMDNNKEVIKENVDKITNLVSLSYDLINKKPHTLSGGQQQRVVIGRAIAVNPNILIADEPIAALDVSIQSQIINTLKSLRDKLELSILFIAHDLNIVRNISNRILVMYRGNIVEEGKTDEIFNSPKHPYTIKLLNSIPELLKVKKIANKEVNFSLANRKMFNITSTHRIFCTKEEFNTWKDNNEI